MKHRFLILDIFRGIFASMVVLFHLSPFAETPLLNNDFVDNSDMFVDFFFVLSGFVISYNYQSIATGEQVTDFLRKRLRRIYPLHLLMLLAFVVVEISKGYLASYVHVNQPTNPNNNVFTFFTSLFLLNSVKMPGVTDVSWNIPSWSISAEMLAYIVFGLGMLLLAKTKLGRYKGFFYGSIALLSFGGLAVITQGFVLNYSFDYGFLRGIIGFFVGGLCYEAFRYIYLVVSQWKSSVFDLAEILMLILIGLMIYYGAALKEVGFVYEFLFFGAILVFSFEKGWVSRLFKKSTFLEKVGTYSYSIYMTHSLLISIFNILFIRILKFPPSAYWYLVFANYYLIYKVSEWTYKNIEMRFKGGPKKISIKHVSE